MKYTIKITSLLIILLVFLSGCKKETCYYCKNYDLDNIDTQLENYKTSFYLCENDDLWDEIIWQDNDYTQGGQLTFIDYDVYIVGFRAIENPDIDGDGILNENDNDIDGDGILNENDYTSTGFQINIVQELILCTSNSLVINQ